MLLYKLKFSKSFLLHYDFHLNFFYLTLFSQKINLNYSNIIQSVPQRKSFTIQNRIILILKFACHFKSLEFEYYIMVKHFKILLTRYYYTSTKCRKDWAKRFKNVEVSSIGNLDKIQNKLLCITNISNILSN